MSKKAIYFMAIAATMALIGATSACSSGTKGYRILYGKTNNFITSYTDYYYISANSSPMTKMPVTFRFIDWVRE